MLKKYISIVALFFWAFAALFLTIRSFADDIKLTTPLTNILWQKDSTTGNIYAPNALPAPNGTDAKVGIGTNNFSPNADVRLDIDGSIRTTKFITSYKGTYYPGFNPTPTSDVISFNAVVYDINSHKICCDQYQQTFTFVNGLLVGFTPPDGPPFIINVP